MVAYAPCHAEQEIPHGSIRRRMALYRPASARAHGIRTPQASRLKGDPRCRLLRLEERLPLAFAAQGLRTPWKTVYDWFRRWRIDGTWERLNAQLRQRLRWRLGRDPHPSAQVLWTPRRPRPPVWEAKSAASTQPSRSQVGSAICSSTPKVWCSKLRYTTPEFQTKTASGCCWIRNATASRAFRTCGWTPDSRGGEGGGPRRFWV